MEYQVTTAVEAPAQAVWDLFVDVERWPTMTKSIQEVRRTDSGPIRVGSEALVKQPRLPRVRWRVTELVPGKSFVWATTSPGVITSGGHFVEPDGNGAVITLTLSERGPLAWLMDGLFGRLTRRYLAMELEGFRRTAESESA
jgi:uncharacterized membrane protein